MTTQIMYDAIVASNLPPGAYAYAGYLDGRWPDFAAEVQKYPGSHILDVAVSPDYVGARGYDIENGNMSVEDAPQCYRNANKKLLPVMYISAADGAYSVDTLISVMSHAGISRDQYLIWSAHWNKIPHICGPESCGVTGYECDATQYASGATYDTSLISPSFFPQPPAPVVVPPVLSVPKLETSMIIIRNTKTQACATFTGAKGTACYIDDPTVTFPALIAAGVPVVDFTPDDYDRALGNAPAT